MLNRKETENTRIELQENYRRLEYSQQKVADDLRISTDELEDILEMESPNPAYVWMLREYLEDKLKEENIEMMPFTKLADPSVNRWYPYETPWRNN